MNLEIQCFLSKVDMKLLARQKFHFPEVFLLFENFYAIFFLSADFSQCLITVLILYFNGFLSLWDIPWMHCYLCVLMMILSVVTIRFIGAKNNCEITYISGILLINSSFRYLQDQQLFTFFHLQNWEVYLLKCDRKINTVVAGLQVCYRVRQRPSLTT